MAKIKTGVEGLDSLVGGGLPPESVVLVSGTPGTGKTILSLQFLAEGARKYKEKGIYITFEERKRKIEDQARQFGWDFKELEEDGLIRVITISKMSLGQIFTEIRTAIDQFKPKRLVIDSLTYITLSAHSRQRLVELEKTPTDEAIFGNEPRAATSLVWDSLMVRKTVIDLVQFLQENNICAILTSETSKNSEWYSRDTLSEFACDGIILLRSTAIGSELHRSIEVVKMRNTKVAGGVYNFSFSKDGIGITR